MKIGLTLLSEPLGLFALALLAGLIVSGRRQGLRATVIAWSPLLLVVMVFMTPLGANLLVQPLEDRAAAAQCRDPQPHTLMILLAGGVSGRESALDRIGSLELASYRRGVAAAARMMVLDDARLLISGGEANVIRSLLLRLGVDGDRIVIEDRSETTADSAARIRGIIADYRPARIELVTTALHMPRALASMSRVGITACAVPVDFSYKEVGLPGAVLPQASALQKSTDSMHEYLGLLYYIIGGRA
jgi:uncharacterized SAM-binding protein YcdF (DUF218 family)